MKLGGGKAYINDVPVYAGFAAADTLKKWIEKGEFLLTEPVAKLPGHESGYAFKPLKERPVSDSI